jgi:hypothetical protein
MDDLAAVEAAIYDQSFRALDEQARVLDALRARAAALLASASVATALLGGLAGVTRPAGHARLDPPSWAAIGLFVSVVLLSLVVMTRTAWAAFAHHPHRLAAALPEPRAAGLSRRVPESDCLLQRAEFRRKRAATARAVLDVRPC